MWKLGNFYINADNPAVSPPLPCSPSTQAEVRPHYGTAKPSRAALKEERESKLLRALPGEHKGWTGTSHGGTWTRSFVQLTAGVSPAPAGKGR